MYLIMSSLEEDAAIQIEESTIKCSKLKKLLGIHIEHNFKSDTHVENDTRIFVKKVTENSMLFQE